jgi:hypothetical protein
MTDPFILGMIIFGMWGAFYLGSRKERKIFERESHDYPPEDMDMSEITDEEYRKSLKSWKINAEENSG